MTYYERHLPHWHPPGKTVFVTWRLHGSLPNSFLTSAKQQAHSSAGRRFLALDRELDKALVGPLWLKDERIAAKVVARLRRGEDQGEYVLHAFVVLANHVHVLLEPKANLAWIMNGLKGATAREANRILGRTGKRFWQDESFDHWIRNSSELERINQYIVRNPVAAGLVEKPEDWPWSSARRSSTD
jgi:putative transposase